MLETVRYEAQRRVHTARVQRKVAEDELSEKRNEVSVLENRVTDYDKVESDYTDLLAMCKDAEALEQLYPQAADVFALNVRDYAAARYQV